tara:strand:- start:357 stop:605 length:249 start_codon:yes stop_codon:yes gene_type:complete
MPKRFNQKYHKLEPLDLHSVKHGDVSVLVEDYILTNQHLVPLKIITGNSDKMKKIVVDVLNDHGFKYVEGDYYNLGYINVLN